jgi:hypothetical protein
MELLTGSRRCAAGVGLLTLALAGCGGGGDDGTGPGGGSGSARISASVDGRVWSSNAMAGMERAVLSAPGLYVVQGVETSGTNNTTITLTLYNIKGPGTYALGMTATTFGGGALVVENTRGWSTPLSGKAGTITLTEVSSTRMAGTFSFTADPITGGATGTKTITNGRFDMPVQSLGTVAALPDNAGSRVSATLNGADYNASTVATGALTTQGGLIFTSTNTERSLGFSLSNIPGPGTYPLSASRLILVGTTTTPPQQWGVQNSTGSVTVATMTATRVTGTFSGSLLPLAPATGTLTVTNGVFDLGRP